jgi:hypothetical protein
VTVDSTRDILAAVESVRSEMTTLRMEMTARLEQINALVREIRTLSGRMDQIEDPSA